MCELRRVTAKRNQNSSSIRHGRGIKIKVTSGASNMRTPGFKMNIMNVTVQRGFLLVFTRLMVTKEYCQVDASQWPHKHLVGKHPKRKPQAQNPNPAPQLSLFPGLTHHAHIGSYESRLSLWKPTNAALMCWALDTKASQDEVTHHAHIWKLWIKTFTLKANQCSAEH